MHLLALTHDLLGDSFWLPLIRGLEEAADQTGVEVEHRRPATYEPQLVLDLLHSALDERPDGLLTTLPEPDLSDLAVRAILDADIPVIVMNTPDPRPRSMRPGVLSEIASDDAEGGRIAAETFLADGRRKTLCIDHYTHRNVCHAARSAAFATHMAEGGGHADILHFDGREAGFARELAARLEGDASPAAILSLGPPGYAAVEEALCRAGAHGRVAHITFDLSEAVVRALAEGRLLGALDCQQFLQGYLAVVFMSLHLAAGFVPPSRVPTGPILVTVRDLDHLRARLDSGRA